MRIHEINLVQGLEAGLEACEGASVQLPGIATHARRAAYVMQVVDSIRRVRFVSAIAARDIHPSRGDGLSEMFDPIKAAVLRKREGDIDEACWLVFLFVHFGKHARSGYRYTREVYSALGERSPWTWARVSRDVGGFRTWLAGSEAALSRGTGRGFGNHRKYESLSGLRPNGTGAVVASYVQWVLAHGGHAALFEYACAQARDNRTATFDWLYRSMNSVCRFGRTARFDYLTMLAKLGLADIEPGSAYYSNATGPVVGARLMFQGNVASHLSATELDRRTAVLSQHLGVGMQVMEDSLCNWQKSPEQYVRFLA